MFSSCFRCPSNHFFVIYSESVHCWYTFSVFNVYNVLPCLLVARLVACSTCHHDSHSGIWVPRWRVTHLYSCQIQAARQTLWIKRKLPRRKYNQRWMTPSHSICFFLSIIAPLKLENICIINISCDMGAGLLLPQKWCVAPESELDKLK